MDSIYSRIIVKMLPKVLSQVDRDKNSKTYGCCDRNHWHLKTRDFSSAILQQTGLALAEIYLNDFKGNIFYQNEQVKEWAIATVYYWEKIQLKDGSFNEYYPNEHGFPPTAFSLFSVCEVYKKLGLNDVNLEKAFDKTARYLGAHLEKKAYNQEMASITALYSYYQISKADWVLQAVENKLSQFLDMQSEEGWFPEYGGADIGYLSVCFDMLAEYYWMSKDERVLEPLNKLTGFIQYFIHPDGTIGGEYASRNTIYFLPNGPEVMSQLGNGIGTAIKNHLYSDSEREYFFLDSVDDRYCSHYVLNSFTRALEKELLNEKGECADKEKLPFEKSFQRFFSHSGFYVYSQEGVYVIIGARKGGVVKCFYNDREVFCDYGYRIVDGKKGTGATSWQDDTYDIKTEDNKIIIQGNFNVVSQKVPSPILHMGLRVISKVVGNKIIGFLKKQIILVDKHSDGRFSRQITIDVGTIRLEDSIVCQKLSDIEEPDGFSLRHVASGKFFATSDIVEHSRNKYHNKKQLKVCKLYDIKNQKWIINEELK